MIRITWFHPLASGGSTINGYEVEIRDSNGDFIPSDPSSGCEGTGIRDSTDQVTGETISICRVDMTVLRAAPYGLAYNEPVVARIRSINAAGLYSDWGISSED